MNVVTMERDLNGRVHCPICTHTVPAEIDMRGRRVRVVAGQRCPRCSATLDVAIVVQVPVAA